MQNEEVVFVIGKEICRLWWWFVCSIKAMINVPNPLQFYLEKTLKFVQCHSLLGGIRNI